MAAGWAKPLSAAQRPHVALQIRQGVIRYLCFAFGRRDLVLFGLLFLDPAGSFVQLLDYLLEPGHRQEKGPHGLRHQLCLADRVATQLDQFQARSPVATGIFIGDGSEGAKIDALHVVDFHFDGNGDVVLDQIIISTITVVKSTMGMDLFQNTNPLEIHFNELGDTMVNELSLFGFSGSDLGAYSQTDVLDFRALLTDETDFTFGVDDIDDYVAITSPNGTGTVFLDADGLGAGSSFEARGTVEGFSAGDIATILVPGGPAGATDFVTVLPDRSVL